MDHKTNLDIFFTPRHIALVGASERGMYPAGLLQNLLDYGFLGDIYPVNPKRETVFDLPCYPNLAQTPQVPDLAILVIPRRFVLPTLRQCVELGVPAALVITAGFAEADDAGKQLQAEISDLLAATQLRVIGPNCAGLANIPGKVIATRLTTPPKAGAISFVSQSGALMMALYGLFADRNLGLNRLISLGNQVDVTLADSLAYLAGERETAVIGAFVEGVQNGRAFAAALQTALTAGKPIVLVKSGRTELGQVAAATHTAALAGSDRVFTAVCQQYGVIQVDDVDEMVDTMELLSTFGDKLRGKRVSLVTQSGGMGSLTADLCHRAGLELPPLSDNMQSQLHNLSHLLQFDDLGNPADVRGASVIGDATAQTLTPFLADRDTDVVILLLAKSALREGEDATAHAIIQAAQSTEKPLIVVWVGQREIGGFISNPQSPISNPVTGCGTGLQSPATKLLTEAGVPVFSSSGRAIGALARAVRYWRFRKEWLADPEVNYE